MRGSARCPLMVCSATCLAARTWSRAHIEELVGTLISAATPTVRAHHEGRVSLGANSAFALVTLISVVLAALQLAGVWTDNEPLTRWQQWSSLVVFAVLAVCFASFAFRAWRRQQQKNPQ